MSSIPDWCALTCYCEGDIVFASDDVAYECVPSYVHKPCYHKENNLNLNPLSLIGWRVWKRYKR